MSPSEYTSSQTYFDFEEDILYISETTNAELFRHGTPELALTRVKHLALDSHSVLSTCHRIGVDYSTLSEKFKVLDTLTFVRDWTTWNLSSWRCWWNLRRLPGPYKGLSFEERCVHEKHIMSCVEWQQDLAKQQEVHVIFDQEHPKPKHPELLIMAYFGTGEFVPAHGSALLDDEEGPRQEPFLKGPEVALLPANIKTALQNLELQERQQYLQLDSMHCYAHLQAERRVLLGLLQREHASTQARIERAIAEIERIKAHRQRSDNLFQLARFTRTLLENSLQYGPNTLPRSIPFCLETDGRNYEH